MQTNTMKRQLPYLLGAAVIFYAVPGIGAAMGDELGFMLTAFGLILLNPAYSLVSGFLFQWKNGFCWYYPILLGALHIPVMPAVLESSPEFFYVALYAALALAGGGLAVLIGWLAKRKQA